MWLCLAQRSREKLHYGRVVTGYFSSLPFNAQAPDKRFATA
jgi:hypothetical protein